MAFKTTTDTRTFTFPYAVESIEVKTYKNQDGGFNRSECIMGLIRSAQNEINALILDTIDAKSSCFYTLRILDGNKAVIMAADDMKGQEGETRSRPNYSTERLVHTLTPEHLRELRAVVLDKVTGLIDLFSQYQEKVVEFQNDNEGFVGRELAQLLRFVTGVKVQYLEDLCAMYLALDCQTYFDVIGHVVLTGAYTLSSLFSTTGLYFRAHGKMRGNSMLQAARRRVVKDEEGRLEKGEIHTSDGLSILFSRQFKVRQQRGPQSVDQAMYEAIVIQDVDAGQSHQPTPFRRQAASLNPEEEYRRQASYRLLTWEGVKRLEEIQMDLVEALSGTEFDATTISAARVGAICEVLTCLAHPNMRQFVESFEQRINSSRKDEIISKLRDVECFHGSVRTKKMEKYIMPFLAITDTEFASDDVSSSYVHRLLHSSTPEEVLLEKVAAFITLVG